MMTFSCPRRCPAVFFVDPKALQLCFHELSCGFLPANVDVPLAALVQQYCSSSLLTMSAPTASSASSGSTTSTGLTSPNGDVVLVLGFVTPRFIEKPLEVNEKVKNE